jgi:hypothetical protein
MEIWNLFLQNVDLVLAKVSNTDIYPHQPEGDPGTPPALSRDYTESR